MRETNTMRTVQKVVLFALSSVLIFSTLAEAQGPAYHPGDEIRISVKFSGPDADKITRVMVNLTIQNGKPGYKADTFPGESKQVGPAKFEVSYKIPDNQASGEYALSEIRVTTDPSAPITFSYVPPADFSAKTFKIENHKNVARPTIDDVKELSHP